MSRTPTRSNQCFRRARRKLPPGVSGTFGHRGGNRTVCVQRASGARPWDIDDNASIGGPLDDGPVSRGCAKPRMHAAAREAFAALDETLGRTMAKVARGEGRADTA